MPISAPSVCTKCQQAKCSCKKTRTFDPRENAGRRGYNHRWRKARKWFLNQSPLCVHCKREGRTTPANVVDHIIPHKGDQDLFWDKKNWQSLCITHHNAKSATEK